MIWQTEQLRISKISEKKITDICFLKLSTTVLFIDKKKISYIFT